MGAIGGYWHPTWMGFKGLSAATGGYGWLLVTIYGWSCYSSINVAIGGYIGGYWPL